MYAAKILADSVSSAGVRLVTIEATYPHVVHAHVLTHRMLSRSTASSRAIPVERMIAAVRANPFVPVAFGRNRPGMQSGDDLAGREHDEACAIWRVAAWENCGHAEHLARINVHKQLANRLVEPYAYTTCLITGTDWSNFYALRTHKDAQPEIRTIATMALEAMDASTPREIATGQWHLPYVTDDERATETADLVRVSAGRSARISYLTHDGRRDLSADVALCDRLIPSGHMGPTEHQATPFDLHEWNAIEEAQAAFRAFAPKSWTAERIETKCRAMEYGGNLRGWNSFRKHIPGESVFTPKAA